MKRIVVRLSVVLAAACAATAVHAGDNDTAAAEALFQDGRKLAEAGNYAEACPKFAASQKLAPAVGTLLNLGDCYEHNDQTATAWTTFRQAISAAQRANRPDREKLARDRAAALEGKLVKLTIKALERDPKLEVTRDGAALDPAILGATIPIDPGKHVVAATAPGKKTWSSTVVVDATRPSLVVEIPVLEATPPDPTPKVEWPSRPPSNTQKIVGGALIGAGVLAAGVGTFFGFKTKSNWSDAQAHCNGTVCDATGVSLTADAKNAGVLSTVFFIAGGAAIAGGLVLFLTAPKPQGVASIRVAPTASGAALGGTFY